MESDVSTWFLLLAAAVLVTFVILGFTFWFIWRAFRQVGGVSPYTGVPLRRALDLPYYTIETTFRYLNSYHQYDNRIFSLKKAAFCRDTGRIFQNAVTWYDAIKVDWSFLRKRYPGYYVSWGSLTRDQQQLIRESHDSLEGFQTEFSCPYPLPREITPEYIYTKPGPLYVDFGSKILLGWKVVPGTNLEVLIVQKPIK